jgi:glycosyltransferase involved in cell wall biosynthesis
MPASLSSLGDSELRDDSNTLRFAWRSIRTAPAIIGYLKDLRRAIREIDPDVFHSNGIKTHLLSRFLIGAAPRATLAWHIHDFLRQRPMVGKLLRRFAGRVSVALAISQAVADDARAALPGVRVEPLLNAIDIDHFSPGAADTRELDRLAGFDPRESVIRVGLVATYARWKGHDVFLDAAAKVLATSSRPEVRFYIVGGPIYQTAGSQFTHAELIERARSLKIADHVGFVDFLSDPVEAYRALDVVVHASTRPEPFGLAIVEAMACGRAVVVSRGGGATELFDEGINAIGMTSGDAKLLADAILRLAGDAKLRKSLGEVARTATLQRFDRHRLGPELLNHYRECSGRVG